MVTTVNIKKIREARNISQRELAALVGMNPVRLCRIENGKRTLKAEDAVKLARALGCSVDALVGKSA